MNLKKHFFKRHVFTVLFLIVLFGFSIANWVHEIPILAEFFKTTDVKAVGISGYVKELETTINDNIYHKTDFIETYGFIQKALRKNEENDFAYVMDENGYLQKSGFTNHVSVSEEVFAEEINDFSEFCADEGAQMVIIRVPGKNNGAVAPMEYGVPVFERTEYGDSVEKILRKKYGLKVYDAYDYFNKAGYDYQTVFYRTDHHWRIEIAFEVYADFVTYLNEKCDANLDSDGYYRDIDNYNYLTYEDAFIGSMARETGVIYGGMDDFVFITSKSMNMYHYQFVQGEGDNKYTMEKTGRAESTILNPILLYESTLEEGDKYTAYLNGVCYSDHITNLSNPNGPRVLMVRDSMMSPIIVYMSPLFSQIDAVWFEHYDDDLKQMIKEGDYDYVIFELNEEAGIENVMRTMGNRAYVPE